MRCLMRVELCEISENFVAELWKSHKNHNEVFDLLPEYSLREDGQLCRADEYLQFVGLETVNEPDKMLFINICAIDHQLDHEFGGAGIVEMFEGINFKSFLNKTGFKPDNEENLSKFQFPTTNYMIVELSYLTSYDYYGGDTDCEIEFDIVGFLSENFSPQFFE